MTNYPVATALLRLKRCPLRITDIWGCAVCPCRHQSRCHFPKGLEDLVKGRAQLKLPLEKGGNHHEHDGSAAKVP